MSSFSTFAKKLPKNIAALDKTELSCIYYSENHPFKIQVSFNARNKVTLKGITELHYSSSTKETFRYSRSRNDYYAIFSNKRDNVEVAIMILEEVSEPLKSMFDAEYLIVVDNSESKYYVGCDVKQD